jgi:hypothetical protein
MTRLSLVALAILIGISPGFAPRAHAQDFNPLEKTYLTFSGPIELPEMTLPAGTYTFKLADTPGRNVVQVLSRDESKIHGQFLFRQIDRRDPSSETIVTFRETVEGATPAVQFWFYPNERTGKEFVYPKDQAVKIAARTRRSVLASDGDKMFRVNEKGEAVDEEREEPTAPSAPAGR